MALRLTERYNLATGLTNQVVIPPGTPFRSLFVHECPQDLILYAFFGDGPSAQGPLQLIADDDVVNIDPDDSVQGLTVTCDAAPGATLQFAYFTT